MVCERCIIECNRHCGACSSPALSPSTWHVASPNSKFASPCNLYPSSTARSSLTPCSSPSWGSYPPKSEDPSLSRRVVCIGQPNTCRRTSPGAGSTVAYAVQSCAVPPTKSRSSLTSVHQRRTHRRGGSMRRAMHAAQHPEGCMRSHPPHAALA